MNTLNRGDEVEVNQGVGYYIKEGEM